MAEAAWSNDWEIVQETVFPIDVDPLVEPLYVTWGEAISGSGAQADTSQSERMSGMSLSSVRGDGVSVDAKVRRGGPQLADLARHSTLLPQGERMSMGTFFNAFPAAYWVQWTNVPRVRLDIEVSGEVRIDVYRSTSRGTFNRIDGQISANGLVSFDIPLKNFGDGGWLWYELVGNDEASRLVRAVWRVEREYRRTKRRGKFAASITTYNRPDDCIVQMQRFGQEDSLRDRLVQLIIVDQGNKLVADAEGFGQARDLLGEQFRYIRQGNLGGSGGFARGMLEGSNTDADYVFLLDDDILIEPAALTRAAAFADYCRKPTLVGGHMLNLYEKSKVQNFGEYVKEYPFRYGPVNDELVDFDFAQNDLRTTPGLHRRIDVGYNGWWMCLIPVEVIREIGLALPVFIKWDDVEYGVRAAEHGYSTVTLPGVGVWHMPFVEKDDRLDWQAYFHQRNRWVAALIHSRYDHGGSLPLESFAADVKHLLAQQYSAVALRLHGLQDVLSGPEHLHEIIGQRTVEIREYRREFSDGQVINKVADYPDVKPRLAKHGHEVHDPTSRMQWLAMAGLAIMRNLVKPVKGVEPEVRLAAQDAKWWRIAAVDSSLVSTSDGNGASVYVRDPKIFRKLLRKSLALHIQMYRRWDETAKSYRDSLTVITSPERWKNTFDSNGVEESQES